MPNRLDLFKTTQVSRVCKNEIDLIHSSKFRRAFKIIFSSERLAKYDAQYYAGLLDKVVGIEKNLTEDEKHDLLIVLKSKAFIEVSTEVFNKLQFTITLDKIKEFISKFESESIRLLLIKETVKKRFYSIFKEKSAEYCDKGIQDKVIIINFSNKEYIVFRDDFESNDNPKYYEAKERTNKNIVRVSIEKNKECYLDLVSGDVIGGHYDKVGGFLEFKGDTYFIIKDDSKFFIMKNNEKLGPFKSIEGDFEIISNNIYIKISPDDSLSKTYTYFNLTTLEDCGYYNNIGGIEKIGGEVFAYIDYLGNSSFVNVNKKMIYFISKSKKITYEIYNKEKQLSFYDIESNYFSLYDLRYFNEGFYCKGDLNDKQAYFDLSSLENLVGWKKEIKSLKYNDDGTISFDYSGLGGITKTYNF